MFDFPAAEVRLARAQYVWPKEPRVARNVRAEYVQQVVKKHCEYVAVVTESHATRLMLGHVC